MSCPENNNCIPCQSECVGEQCLDKNYQDVQCAESYPFKCSVYTGEDIPCLSINNGDTGDIVLSKLANAVCDAVIPSADIKFKISAADAGNGYFEDKILAGAGITFTKTLISGNEVITMSSTGGASSPSLVVNSSDSTIESTLTGTGNHTADLRVKLSPFAGNLITKRVDGLYVADTFKSKVSDNDTTGGSLFDKLQAGSGITLIKINTGANEAIQISSSASAGMTSVTRNNTSTISFSGTGASNSPLLANVKISTNPNNILGVDGEGLIVLAQSDGKVKTSALDSIPNYLVNKILPGTNVSVTPSTVLGSEVLTIGFSQTPITVNDSTTIDLTASGSNNHTLSAAVKVSALNGNLITVESDGLHVAAPVVVIPPVIANDSASLDFTVSGLDSHTITGTVKVSSTLGNAITIDGTGLYVPSIPPIIATDSASIDFTVSAPNSHTITGVVKVSSTVGNILSVDGTGLFVPDNSNVYTAGAGIDITGNVISTVVPVITSYDGLSDLPIFSNGITKTGTATKLGGTLTESTTINMGVYNLDISGAGLSNFTNTKTYSSGTSATIGAAANVTYAGVLPSSNISFSSVVNNHNSIFNGNTTVAGSTPFGSSITSSIVSFTSTGTVTMNNGLGGGLKSIAAIIAATFDSGSVNGTVTKSSGIQINGIFQTVGSTSVITRTDHYQLLINDTDEFGDAGNITNKWGVYQVGAGDVNLFNGAFNLPNLPVYADNTAAASLPTGQLYRTVTGTVMVKY